MSTHNIGFYEDLTKIIFQLSSNMHGISSSECVPTGYLQPILLKRNIETLISLNYQIPSS